MKRRAPWNSILQIKFMTLEASAFPSEEGKYYVIAVSDEEFLEPYNACPEDAGQKWNEARERLVMKPLSADGKQ